MFGSKTAFRPEIQKPGSLSWPFRLGDEVKDKLNGLTGVVIGRFFHITGCDTFAVEIVLKEGVGYDPAKLIDAVRGKAGLY